MKEKSNTITKQTISDSIENNIGISNSHAQEIVDLFFKTINQGLQEDGIVKIARFGTFKVQKKKERLGRNPKSMEDAIIKSRQVVTFKVSDTIKNKLNHSDQDR